MSVILSAEVRAMVRTCTSLFLPMAVTFQL